jgi:hypothetical protein
MPYRYKVHSLDIPGVADAIAMVRRHDVPVKAIVGPQDAIAKLKQSPSISAWGIPFIIDDSLEHAVITSE